MDKKRQLGDQGEEIGVSYLQSKGYVILERNYRTNKGEIDIIAYKEDVVFFIEVKTRSSNIHGYPEEAVTPRKLIKMQAAADSFLNKQIDRYYTWQFDILAITMQDPNHPEIEHIENVIS